MDWLPDDGIETQRTRVRKAAQLSRRDFPHARWEYLR
jgi:hypothetical protein